uniref:Calpain catalytic domain-containing protein n=1 Tax=Myripristis murdjan TaxID=586833 RepID=A0A667WSL4_9TELE
ASHQRERGQGIGTNSHAVKYLNQDYEALRRNCFESGRLFQDETFPALASSLGFKELGPKIAYLSLLPPDPPAFYLHPKQTQCDSADVW